MIFIDDIMSEIELEISRVRRTSEMSCLNFTNLISSLINHTTCYIWWDNIMNEIQNYSFICQTDKFISIKNRNDESKWDNNFFVFYYRCDSHATKDFTRFHWIIHDHVIHELYCQKNTKTKYSKQEVISEDEIVFQL
jgi:hypothetical protein